MTNGVREPEEDEMGLVYKELKDIGRSMYLYFPEQERRTAFRRSLITVLRDGEDEASVRRLLEEQGLRRLAEEKEAILSFPNPRGGKWNYSFEEGENDVAAFQRFQEASNRETEEPMECRTNGIPTHEAMMSVWHPMHDVRYLIGTGSGASMACTLAACVARGIAGILAVGGGLCEKARRRSVGVPVAAYLVNCDSGTRNYFRVVNETAEPITEGDIQLYANKRNAGRCVLVEQGERGLEELFTDAWNRLFGKVRRPDTDVYGDPEPRMDLQKAGFELFLDDTRLEEPVRKKHTWFTSVPESVRQCPEKKVPLMIFFHGGSDNPAEAADMSKFHELGEQEGFITVYPWGTDKTQWNSTLEDPRGEDDMSFSLALIDYMIANYPVDPGRVYLSGFSNGAMQAQTVALLHPEKIAAICHMDSNWPGNRMGPSEVDYRDVVPFRLGMEKKKEYDYLMPVWYTYGSREPSYPVYAKCTQQYQYDFWKAYNHIAVRETPGREAPDPCGCGIPGQVQERLRPSDRHPRHYYDVQRFYTEEGLNLYNFVAMHHKGHDIAQMDARLGWEYVRRFRRNPDGSLEVTE